MENYAINLLNEHNQGTCRVIIIDRINLHFRRYPIIGPRRHTQLVRTTAVWLRILWVLVIYLDQFNQFEVENEEKTVQDGKQLEKSKPVFFKIPP